MYCGTQRHPNALNNLRCGDDDSCRYTAMRRDVGSGPTVTAARSADKRWCE